MKQRIRILIADDQPPTRQGLYALLALYPKLELVGQASDGSEAVRMVAESRPDVVLMDMRMPVMDGLEATRRIKRHWPEVRVIGLTLYGRYQALAVSAGVDAFLIKGCTTETLLAAILTSNTRKSKADQGSSLET
jgi:DNA-binding NarL/FixJ family response regulator